MFCVSGSQMHGNYSKINISLDAEFLSSLFTFLSNLVKNTTDISPYVMFCTISVFWIKTGGDHDFFILIFIFGMQEIK